MITIEILKSNEETALGLYEYDFDIIHLGRSLKNDLIFSDKELPLKYLQLKIIEDKGVHNLIVKSLSTEPYFFINGKKITGTLKIRPGDTIAFGANKLIISDFKKTQTDVDLREAFERFDKASPELRFALEFIEEVLIEQEKNQNV